jgi:hypothetical protein
MKEILCLYGRSESPSQVSGYYHVTEHVKSLGGDFGEVWPLDRQLGEQQNLFSQFWLAYAILI